MDIHEYQAKELLSKFGVPIPRGGLAYSPEQATYRATEIGGKKWVVKAQIHSGARGKAGGIKLCTNDNELEAAAEALLGKKLVTHQTGPSGKLVSRLYIEEGTDIAKEIYLAFVMDRATERIMVVASAAGGMEIEEISAKQPDTIIRVVVDPAVGMQAFQAREVAYGLGVDPEIINKLVPTIMGCYRAFRDLDATMVEINPLGDHQGQAPCRARRQDVVRRQRALPPSAHRGIARQEPGGPARDVRFRPRPGLRRPRRRHRLRRQRRRPRHGDARHDQARRRRACELPRHRRRRLALSALPSRSRRC